MRPAMNFSANSKVKIQFKNNLQLDYIMNVLWPAIIELNWIFVKLQWNIVNMDKPVYVKANCVEF